VTDSQTYWLIHKVYIYFSFKTPLKPFSAAEVTKNEPVLNGRDKGYLINWN